MSEADDYSQQLKDDIFNYLDSNNDPNIIINFIKFISENDIKLDKCFIYKYHSESLIDSCYSCELAVCSNCIIRCDNYTREEGKCRKDVCIGCKIKCSGLCEGQYCKRHAKLCEFCYKYYCNECEDRHFEDKCYRCNKNFIGKNACIHNYQYIICRLCDEKVCKDCSSITCAYNCSNGLVGCPWHFVDCISCKKYYCDICVRLSNKKYYPRDDCRGAYYCDNCIQYTITCKCGIIVGNDSGHVRKCNYCDIKYCDKCMTQEYCVDCRKGCKCKYCDISFTKCVSCRGRICCGYTASEKCKKCHESSPYN